MLEKTETESRESSEREARPLYPERESLDRQLEAKLDYLSRAESGAERTLELSPEQREKVLVLENILGNRLLEAKQIPINGLALYPEYFLSESGRKAFVEIFSVEPKDLENVKETIATGGEVLGKLDAKAHATLQGDSYNYARDQFLDAYFAAQFDVSKIKDPDRQAIILEPEKVLEKTKKLRALQADLRTIEQEMRKRPMNVSSEDAAMQCISRESDEVVRASMQEVVGLYRDRTAELLADNYEAIATIAAKRELVDNTAISDSEWELLENRQLSPGIKNWQRALDRYDKFSYGASGDYNASGYRVQIPAEIKKLAEESRRYYVEESKVNEKEILRAGGIDPDKVEKEKIKVDHYKMWTRRLLESYGFFDPNRPEDDRRAVGPETLWTVRTAPELSGLWTPSREKIAHVPASFNRSITEALPVCAHEVAHALQTQNRERVAGSGMVMAEKIGFGHDGMITEGGGMLLEGKFKQEIFGLPRRPLPGYVFSMERRLQGGSFKDCFDVRAKIEQEQLARHVAQGIVRQEDAATKLRKKLETTFSATRRLFGGAMPYDSTAPYIGKSEATAYLEQESLLKRMADQGKERFALLGVGFDSLIRLHRAGLLDLTRQIPYNEVEVRKIWEEEKEAYALTE